MIVIGTRNRSLKAPPEWATPDGHAKSDYFGLFESRRGQWAFLATERGVWVAGSENDWKPAVILDPCWNVLLERLPKQIDELVQKLQFTMDENERLWLSVSLRSAADHFQALGAERT